MPANGSTCMHTAHNTKGKRHLSGWLASLLQLLARGGCSLWKLPINQFPALPQLQLQLQLQQG